MLVRLFFSQMIDALDVPVGCDSDHEKAALDVAVGEVRNRLRDALPELSQLISARIIHHTTFRGSCFR